MGVVRHRKYADELYALGVMMDVSGFVLCICVSSGIGPNIYELVFWDVGMLSCNVTHALGVIVI